MNLTDKNIELNFFEQVAKHNLERFHSECIVWAFNYSSIMLHNFIKSVAKDIGDKEIVDAKAYCEIQSIDILLSYKLSSQQYFIHIENKIKATEHFVKVYPDKLQEKFKKKIDKNIEMSQTEFYYLRDKEKIVKNLVPIGEPEWQYIYLVPAICDEKKQNTWNQIDIENPWKTISYWDVIKCMPDVGEVNKYEKNETNNVIFIAYKNYLENHFIIKGNNSDYQVVIKNDGISTRSLNNALDLNSNSTFLEKYSLRLHFKSIKEELEVFQESLKREYQVNFLTDTGNNGGFLLEVFTIANLNKHSSNIFTRKGPIDFRIGFQFEQNEKDKGRFKLYFADKDYNRGLIAKKGKKAYHDALHNSDNEGILQKIFSKELLVKKKYHRNKDGNIKFNRSTSKSFCSYSVNDFKFNDKNDLERIFKDELKALDDVLSYKYFETLLNEKFN